VIVGVLRQKLGPNFGDYFRRLGDFATSSCENLLLDLELACLESTIACHDGWVVLVGRDLGFITSTIAVLVFAVFVVFTVVISLVATSVFLAPVLINPWSRNPGVGIEYLQEMTSVL
jgi:hypothetical protein